MCSKVLIIESVQKNVIFSEYKQEDNYKVIKKSFINNTNVDPCKSIKLIKITTIKHKLLFS